jgi:hypothetical protein
MKLKRYKAMDVLNDIFSEFDDREEESEAQRTWLYKAK